MCNQEIKFKLFLEAALADGADLIATGHYARVHDDRLLTARDANKDQTYFLYRVTRQALSRTLFPLGALTKPEVRRLAAEFGLPTAAKPDSQGICFVGEVGMKEFLRQYLTVAPGPVLDRATGAVLGEHEGAVFYTIGQRHGLGIGGGAPYYVTGKDMAANTVYVTTDQTDLSVGGNAFELENIHWIGDAPEAGRTYQIRTRYRAALIDGALTHEGQRWGVKLAQAARAVSPGQSAVIYDGEVVLGGGIIA
jgi:tRNA-specific 2-thiouridylase